LLTAWLIFGFNQLAS